MLMTILHSLFVSGHLGDGFLCLKSGLFYSMGRYNKVSIHTLPLAVEIIIGHHNPTELDMHSLIKHPLKCVPESCAVAAGMLERVTLGDVELVDRSDVPFFVLLHLVIYIP